MRIWGDRNERPVVTPPVTPPPVIPVPESGSSAPAIDWGQWEARWQVEDERWDRHVLTSELAMALDRMGNSESSVLRIYGARCLTDLALKNLPGTQGALMSERFPFFAPAANCLAAAVPLEEHPAVRYEIRVALDALIHFAREGGQQMLYVLIQALAEANRAALRAFTDALGRYLAKHGAEERALPPLIGFLPFSANREATMRCLQKLAQDPETEMLRDRQAALRVAQATFGEPAATANNTLIDTLAQRGARLIDARDALANALHALTPPPPESQASAKAFEDWRQTRRLYLYGVFLVGARLAGVQLPGCILAKAHLQGANLEGANLVAADFVQTHLDGAELFGAQIDDKQRPQLRANLREANWWNASANSWRGTPGQALRQFLELNFPQPEPPPEPELVLEDSNDTGLTDEMMVKIHGEKFNEALPATPPAMPAPSAAGQSAADKIAELKRRRQGGAPTASAEAPPVKPTTAKRGIDPSESVVVRDKGLPDPKAKVSATDLAGIADLLKGTPDVQVRESGRPRNADVSSRDLNEVTDLMKDR